MRRQLPDGTYKWLGVGRGILRGENLSGTFAATGRPTKAYVPRNGGGRKRLRAGMQ